MAILSLCGTLKEGQDASCANLVTRYEQQAVLINKNDLNYTTIFIGPRDAPDICDYSVKFSLNPGKKGYRFSGSETGNSYKGLTAKVVNNLGNPKQKHSVQILIVGADENSKCILDSLSKGRFVVAIQLTDGVVEIYGIQNGLIAEDYTYDIQEGGGGAIIILSSPENSPENYLPLIYKSSIEGGENADFDSDFENIGPL